jgi:hypothetical protein
MKITLLLLLVLMPAGSRAQTSSLSQLSTLGGFDPAITENLAKEIDKGLNEKTQKDAAERPLLAITEKTGEDGRISKFLVIHTAQLNKPYLFTSNIERGPSDGSIPSAMMDDTFLCVFKQVGDKIIFARRQTEYRAVAGSAESRAIDQSIADQILTLLPIVARDADNSYVTVPAPALFLADLTRIEDVVKSQHRRSPMRMPQYRPDASSLEKLAAFPKNVEARVHLVYSLSNPEEILSVTMRYSITDLPENKGFEPRPADPRVGYFTTSYQNLGRADMKHKAYPVEHLINRWDLRKKDPDAAVSEVEKPITFWLEDTVPEDYRPAIKAGILSWNRAFEAVGLKNAIEVKEVDKDLTAEQRASFDPADISYNMVRWFVGYGFAIGPSRVNPHTGEILNSSVSVGDLITRFVSGDLDLMASAGEAAAGHKHTAACRHDEAMLQASTGLRLLQGQKNVTQADIDRYQYEFIIELMAHEIGHNLGLRHNFKGSNAASKNGSELHSTSVMDYLPAKIAGKGQTQGAFYQTQVGAYDKWAIEYGYAPLSGDKNSALKSIAARSGSDPLLAYGTDEDADKLDPDTQRFDDGGDPVAHAKGQVSLAKDLLKKLDSDVASSNYDSAELQRQFGSGFRAYFMATRQVLPLIGGMRSQRGPAGKFTPVTAQEQREALKFLEKEIFSKDAMKVSPGLLLSMGSDQTSFAYNSPASLPAVVGMLQDMALSKIYDPGVLSRLSNGELYGQPEGNLSPGELMDRVRRAVWSEVAAGKPVETVSLTRRNLQALHLDKLIGVAASSPSTDARAAARRDLERIKRDLSRSVSLSKDETTTLHLKQQLLRVKDALEKKTS